MEHLFADWSRVATKLRRADNTLILLDYDGTLTPIRAKPGLALFPKRTRELLNILSANPRFKLGIVSGRALTDLKRLVKIKGIIYVGNHGLEIDKKFVHPEAVKAKPVIQRICRLLEHRVSRIKGVIIDNKTFTLSVHYRLVASGQVAKLKKEIRDITKPYIREGSIVVKKGKKVFEINPAIDWDKGKAVLRLIKKEAGKQTLPIYIGDDRTDEDAFRVLKKRGLSICVGRKRSSQAKYFLRTVSEVERFLGILAYNFKTYEKGKRPV